MEKLSVVIITFNEEKNIGRCIDSVKKVADEIIVLDSFSADKTVSIAKENGATVYQHSFSGYTEQKNKALEFANNNYVLSLDADEALDGSLEASVLQVKEKFTCSGYTMNRCTNYCGKFIRHGSWYPDKKLRLFDKRVAKWAGHLVHEEVELTTAGTQTMHLKGDILHYSFYNMEEHLSRIEQYSTLSAQAYFAKGKRTSWVKKLFNPAWNFITGYILRLGFLDGRAGYRIANISAKATYLKYKKLGDIWKETGK